MTGQLERENYRRECRHDDARNPGLGGPALRPLLSQGWSSSIAVTAAVLPGWHPEAVGKDKDESHLVLQW